jgi:4-hydroxy-2-oxoheptanedioate aldolase
MTINTFKQALKEGRPQLGLWGSLTSPYLAEAMATCGFDWYLIDGEHAPNDLHSILGQLQSLAAYPTQPVVRPRISDVPLIKQLLEIGAQTLLVPMIDTAEQAARTVAAMRYPPQGIRGVGSSAARSSRWSATKGYLHGANEQMCLLVQCETVTALSNLGEIAAVDGVDGVFAGPSDLAAALGHLGNPGEASVQAAIAQVFAAAKSAGKPSGILTPVEADARRYLAMGATFVAVGSDLGVFRNGTQALRDKFKAA